MTRKFASSTDKLDFSREKSFKSINSNFKTEHFENHRNRSKLAENCSEFSSEKNKNNLENRKCQQSVLDTETQRVKPSQICQNINSREKITGGADSDEKSNVKNQPEKINSEDESSSNESDQNDGEDECESAETNISENADEKYEFEISKIEMSELEDMAVLLNSAPFLFTENLSHHNPHIFHAAVDGQTVAFAAIFDCKMTGGKKRRKTTQVLKENVFKRIKSDFDTENKNYNLLVVVELLELDLDTIKKLIFDIFESKKPENILYITDDEENFLTENLKIIKKSQTEDVQILDVDISSLKEFVSKK